MTDNATEYNLQRAAYAHRDRFHRDAVQRLTRGEDPNLVLPALRSQYRSVDQYVAARSFDPTEDDRKKPWIQWLREACAARGQRAVAAQIGFSRSAVGQALRGTYLGNVGNVQAAVERFLGQTAPKTEENSQ